MILRKKGVLLVMAVLLGLARAADQLHAAILRTANRALLERLRQAPARPEEPGPGPRTERYQAPDRLQAILAGGVAEASLHDMLRFVDSCRAASRRLEGEAVHPRDCVCWDHVPYEVLLALARRTHGHAAYGYTVLQRPGGSWRPPQLRLLAGRDTRPSKAMRLFPLYMGVGLVGTVVFALAAYLAWRSALAGRAARRTAAAAGRPPGFDISRVDMLD